VELKAVPVTVSRALLTALDDDTAGVSITCSAGFYVRSFAHELGRMLGCGACLDAARRTRSGEFSAAAAVPLEELAAPHAGTALALARDLLRSVAARLPHRPVDRFRGSPMYPTAAISGTIPVAPVAEQPKHPRAGRRVGAASSTRAGRLVRSRRRTGPAAVLHPSVGTDLR
jgi:hypothetical protein